MAANTEAEISQRPVTGEPLYVIFNLGMSTSFTTVDIDDLVFPATMRIVRRALSQRAEHRRMALISTSLLLSSNAPALSMLASLPLPPFRLALALVPFALPLLVFRCPPPIASPRRTTFASINHPIRSTSGARPSFSQRPTTLVSYFSSLCSPRLC